MRVVDTNFALFGLAVGSTILSGLVAFVQREKGFPMEPQRKAGAVVLMLDAAIEWIAFGVPVTQADAGWLFTIAMVAMANLVIMIIAAVRGMGLPSTVRWMIVVACACEPPLMWLCGAL